MLFFSAQNEAEAKKERARKEAEAKNELAEANRLWDSGQKSDAVSKYKSILNKGLVSVPDGSERPTVYQRVIDFDVEQGNMSGAQAMVEKALDDKVNPSSDNKATQTLVVQVRAEREKKEAEAKRKAEEDAKQRAEASAKVETEAKHKAEEEFDSSGLVLLRKSVHGQTGEFTTEITGTVINRRASKLAYAQITFNVYNERGAQVGSALANINGLEPGGKWDFKAVYFGADCKTYKFSELSGF